VAIRGIVLLSFFLASLPVCFVRPFYGIVLWAIVAFLNPQNFIWMAADTFPWALAVAIATMAGFALFCRDWVRRLVSREVFLILLLWSWFTVTSFVSANTPEFVHHSQDTWFHWWFVTKVLLMTLLTVAIVDSFSRLKILVMVIAGSFGVFVAKSIPFIVETRGGMRVYGPENSMVADNNDFGLALNMTLPLFFYLAQTETKPWLKRTWAFLVVCTIPAVFFTYSRGALVGLIAVSVLMLLRSRHRLVIIPVIALGILFAMLFAPQTWRNRMDPTTQNALDGSARSRLNSWAYSWRLALNYPISGGGFATFTPELFHRYAPNPKDDTHGAHSIYFQVLAEHGFVGLALYLTLVLSCFATAGRLRKRALAYGDTQVGSYADMFRFSLVGFLASGFFLGRAYFDYYFMMVACLAILNHVATERWAHLDEAEDEEPESMPAYGDEALLET
jgi:probable O-glycosylation ligase (exosortase A-associated)